MDRFRRPRSSTLMFCAQRYRPYLSIERAVEASSMPAETFPTPPRQVPDHITWSGGITPGSGETTSLIWRARHIIVYLASHIGAEVNPSTMTIHGQIRTWTPSC